MKPYLLLALVVAAILAVPLGIIGYTTFIAKDCRLQFSVEDKQSFIGIENVVVNVDRASSGITDYRGNVEVTGVRCDSTHTVTFSKEEWKTTTVTIPAGLELGPRDVGWAPTIILMEAA